MKSIIFAIFLLGVCSATSNKQAPLEPDSWWANGAAWPYNGTETNLVLPSQAFVAAYNSLLVKGRVNIALDKINPGVNDPIFVILVNNASLGQLSYYNEDGFLYCIYIPIPASSTDYYRTHCNYTETYKRDFIKFEATEHNFVDVKVDEYICDLFSAGFKFKTTFNRHTNYQVSVTFPDQILENYAYDDERTFDSGIFEFINKPCLNGAKRSEVAQKWVSPFMPLLHAAGATKAARASASK